jgi:general secretion pathway protein A
MYEVFFGLRERPFDLSPDSRYLFLAASHQEALSNLDYGLSARKGVTLLIGDAGMGKTTLVRAVLASYRKRDALCVYLNNPTLTRSEFLRFLVNEFHLPPAAASDKVVCLRELEAVLLRRAEADQLSALFIDEAQSMPHELLEEVRLLANMETDTMKLLPLILAGQPELAGRLNDPSLRQLKQRIALRCELKPFDLGRTAAYIATRIRTAGGEAAKVFTREAVCRIHEASQGIPRVISVICDNALVAGFAAGTSPINSRLVEEVCRDFDLSKRAPQVESMFKDDPQAEGDPGGTAGEDEGEPSSVTEPQLFGDYARRRRLSFF